MELFGLSPQELFVIAIVAILVFGSRLPQVAGEAAATVQKFRRALQDLRRESGIDHELTRARREIEDNVVRPFREIDVAGTVRRETKDARAIVEGALSRSSTAPTSAPKADATPRSDDAKTSDPKASEPKERDLEGPSDLGEARPPDPEAPGDPHRD